MRALLGSRSTAAMVVSSVVFLPFWDGAEMQAEEMSCDIFRGEMEEYTAIQICYALWEL